jgi:hypothetical protein
MTLPPSPSGADTRYEWQAILLLALGFGLVGLDRWIIAPLFLVETAPRKQSSAPQVFP